jgi:lipopolysaccharide transport system permease protein
MYATPIVYPLSQVPDRFRWIFIINPLTAPVENFRYAFYGVGGTNLLTLMVSAVSSLFIIFLGLILFNHSEQSFIDVV